MAPPPLAPPGGRLARRLFVLFVGVALLPLAVSDWLSHTAVTDVADRLQQQRREQTTRQVSRQVYDRLLAARLLIASWPAAPRIGASDADLPGLGTVFRHAARVGPGGEVVWAAGGRPAPTAPGLPALGASRDHAPTGRPDSPGVWLQVGSAPGNPAPVWLYTASAAARWVAEIDPGHLWAPVEQAGDDAAWQVRETRGRVLLALRGADYPAGAPLPGEATAGTTALDTDSALFLEGSFGSGDWTFVQRAPRAPVHWQGHPLGVWLALVAAATLLTIAYLARRQIRRLLEPLERLTEGTGRIAAGQGNTRVAVRRNDEIGRLAGSFNRMAERIEAQFDALAGMTAIDRDILDGAAPSQVVERVLRRLRAEVPGAAAYVAWLDGPHTLVGATLADDPSQGLCTSVVELDDAALERFRALGDDRSGPAGADDGPWLPACHHAAADTEMLFPLRLQEQTAAVLGLRFTGPEPADLRQRASDLRDRLSVAMAARAREQELVYRAAHDSLTGLVNRYGLHQRLDTLLQPPTPVLAVLFVDLDHFKDVNDSRGHAAGDELLCEASARLQALAPAGALVSRQGGDEFAIVLPGAGAAEAEACARAAVDALSRPYTLQDATHLLGASVGVSLCPQHGDSREELLRRADVALYAAKSGGRGCHVVFSPDLDVVANDRMRLLAELRRAIERSEFVVFFQPRVLSSDGSIRSAEALVR